MVHLIFFCMETPQEHELEDEDVVQIVKKI